MKQKLGMILLFILVLGLTGCWDYTEVEQINFAVGTGIDETDGEPHLIAEIIKTKGVGQTTEFKPVVLSTQMRSLSSATRVLSTPAGMTLMWPHAFIFLVSEEVAKKGITSAIENVARGRDLRSTVYLLVVKDATTEEVFKSKPPFSDTVSQHIASIVRNHANHPLFFPEEMWKFQKNLMKRGISGALPTVQLVEEGGEKVPIVRGTAIFKEGKMVGWIDGDESQIFCILKGLPLRGRFVMETDVDGERHRLTYEVINNRVEIKPQIEGEQLAMSIKLTMQLNIDEIDDASINFEDDQIVKAIEEQVNRAFERRMRELLSKLNQEINSDALGLGLLLKQTEPKFWRTVEGSWDEYLANLDVSVTADTKIILSGVMVKSMTLRH